MKNLPILLGALLAGASLGLISGCASYHDEQAVTASAEVEVQSDPPAPLEETIPATPGYGYIWIGGAWTWHNRWTWETGHWQRPPHPGAVWIAHRYENRNGHRIFIRGGWR